MNQCISQQGPHLLVAHPPDLWPTFWAKAWRIRLPAPATSHALPARCWRRHSWRPGKGMDRRDGRWSLEPGELTLDSGGWWLLLVAMKPREGSFMMFETSTFCYSSKGKTRYTNQPFQASGALQNIFMCLLGYKVQEAKQANGLNQALNQAAVGSNNLTRRLVRTPSEITAAYMFSPWGLDENPTSLDVAWLWHGHEWR